MAAVDELSLEIIRHLWDGRMPYSRIAKDLKVTENTIRTRVNNLLESGVLQIIGLANPDAIPGHGSAFVGLKVEFRRTREITKEIRKLKGVVASAAVAGRYDVLCLILTNDEFTVKDFLQEELVKVEGIITTETIIVLGGEGWNLRYVL